MKISLKLDAQEHIDKTFDKAAVTIGRSMVKCDFAVPDETLSRTHCLIELVDGKFYVTDLGSANGVFIDGERIQPNTRLLYSPFLPLMIGRYECQLTQDRGTISLMNVLPIFEKENRQLREKNQLKKKEAEKKKTALPALLLLLILVAGSLWWFTDDSVPDGLGESSGPVKLRPRPKRIPPPIPSLMTVTNYMRLFSRRSCTDGAVTLCNQLQLELPHAEGIYQEHKRLIIFLNPSYHLQDPLYKGLKDNSRRENLVGLHKVLKSNVPDELISGKREEVYLVLMNSVGVIKTIHGFKLDASFPKSEVLEKLEKEIQALVEGTFLETYSSLFPEYPIGGGFR